MGCEKPTDEKNDDDGDNVIGDEKDDEIDEFVTLYNSVNQNVDIDLDYEVIIHDSMYNPNFKSGRIVIKNDGKNQIVFHDPNSSIMYSNKFYIDNLIFSEIELGYKAEENTTYKIEDDYPIIDFDFSTLIYSKVITQLEDSIEYKIQVTDPIIGSIIEEMYGLKTTGMTIKFDIIILQNKETKQLEKINYEVSLSSDNFVTTLDSLIIINALGEQVSFEAPYQVYEAYNQYLNINRLYNPPEYKDSEDGVVKYYNLGTYQTIRFDKVNNKLAILRGDKIEIFNPDTMTRERTITSLNKPTCIDVDNGKLVVGYDQSWFDVYDLSINKAPTTIQTIINVYDILIDGDMVMFDNDDEVNLYNLLKQERYPLSYSDGNLFLNRRDHILQIASSNSLSYVSSIDASSLFYGNKPSNSTEDASFDGKYLHFKGITYNNLAQAISSNNLNQNYPSFENFEPALTLFDNDEIAFVRGQLFQNQIGIYDNAKYSFVYSFPFDNGKILELNDNKFLAYNENDLYVAYIDKNLIIQDYVNDIYKDRPNDMISTSSDNKVLTLTTSYYTKSFVDDKYIYTINQNDNQLTVYDNTTLEIVYSEKMILKPSSLDVYENKLVIACGNAMLFRIYNTDNWTYETVSANDQTYNIATYKDLIIYSNYYAGSAIYSYNMKTRTHQAIEQSNYASFAINHKSGILFIVNSRTTYMGIAFYDMENQKILIKQESKMHEYLARFDGYFFSFNGNIWDGFTAEKLIRSQMRNYQTIKEYRLIDTIIDNGVTSVFCAYDNELKTVVIYDVPTNTELYAFRGKATNGYQVGNRVIILENNSNRIRIVNIE